MEIYRCSEEIHISVLMLHVTASGIQCVKDSSLRIIYSYINNHSTPVSRSTTYLRELTLVTVGDQLEEFFEKTGAFDGGRGLTRMATIFSAIKRQYLKLPSKLPRGSENQPLVVVK